MFSKDNLWEILASNSGYGILSLEQITPPVISPAARSEGYYVYNRPSEVAIKFTTNYGKDRFIDKVIDDLKSIGFSPAKHKSYILSEMPMNMYVKARRIICVSKGVEIWFRKRDKEVSFFLGRVSVNNFNFSDIERVARKECRFLSFNGIKFNAKKHEEELEDGSSFVQSELITIKANKLMGRPLLKVCSRLIDFICERNNLSAESWPFSGTNAKIIVGDIPFYKSENDNLYRTKKLKSKTEDLFVHIRVNIDTIFITIFHR